MKLTRLFILAAITLAGCAPKAMIQQTSQAPSAPSAPVAVSAPALVDTHTVVPDADDQAALTRTAGAEVSDSNAADYQLIAQSQYDHADLGGALKIYQKLAQVSVKGQDKAQYMVGQIYYDQRTICPPWRLFKV